MPDDVHAPTPIPAQDDKYSRLIFHDLTPDLARLRGEGGTAFIPHSVKIGLAGVYGKAQCPHFKYPSLTPRPHPRTEFRDQPYIEAVHFSNKSCPFSTDPFAASFTTTDNSRSEVSFFVDSELPECALPAPGKAFTFLNLNRQCARTVVGGEHVIGLSFEPRCVVVTLATRSRRELLDQLLVARRMLDDPL